MPMRMRRLASAFKVKTQLLARFLGQNKRRHCISREPSSNRPPIRVMSALKHIIGIGSVAITLDFFLFNGFCTDAFSQILTQAGDQMVAQLELFRTFL
jgi:hypothetical protein